ncbi:MULTISPECIES: hypothetical protein [unclassified Prevotella]|uniref:hypothetical protein n=1 Tax=unclassified Prevotella TaxID=2638335 RepID=UPI000CE9DBE1|nr:MULTISPECIES: hypothetical protein [unclassified Prevotella]NPD55336.1 hypothetical protein [Prevotella sp. PTAC]GAY27198.1 hypothetical protein PvtlMGM1_0498 [Prevotella sp. MGM1]
MNKDSEVDNVMLTYGVDTDLLNSINANLAERLGTDTRTTVTMTEQEAQEILSPLVQQGCEMRNELVQLAEDEKIDLSAMEVKELKDMNDYDVCQVLLFSLQQNVFIMIAGGHLMAARCLFARFGECIAS